MIVRLCKIDYTLVQVNSTALELACSKEHWPVVELLRDAGAILNVPETENTDTSVANQAESSVCNNKKINVTLMT